MYLYSPKDTPLSWCFVITLMLHPFELFSFVLHHFSSTYFLAENEIYIYANAV